jgi:nucleotide-binding universal stress UspA family protein
MQTTLNNAATGARVELKNILYLTDFSEPSTAALPFANAIARKYGARLHALHVLLPKPYIYTTPELTIAALDSQEESAQEEMQVVDAQLAGVAHDVSVVRGLSVWPAAWEAIENQAIDLIVLGTRGRTGTEKLLLGSAAEEIFRRSQAPVVTIGPYVKIGAHSGGRFHRVLLAYDGSAESRAAVAYALSFAEENQARLVLLEVLPKPTYDQKARAETSVANAMHGLQQLIPVDEKLSYRPEMIVEFGDPAEQILGAARARSADLIVLGVRDASGHLGAATHLGTTIAHKVVAHAPCAVLTVRGLRTADNAE